MPAIDFRGTRAAASRTTAPRHRWMLPASALPVLAAAALYVAIPPAHDAPTEIDLTALAASVEPAAPWGRRGSTWGQNEVPWALGWLDDPAVGRLQLPAGTLEVVRTRARQGDLTAGRIRLVGRVEEGDPAIEGKPDGRTALDLVYGSV